jgi:hypothetical protein
MASNVLRMIRIALVFACVAPALAHGQWKWRDAQGGIHYSDQPPPVQIPQRDILRAADGSPPSASMPARPGTDPAPPPPSPPPLNLLEPTRDTVGASASSATKATSQSAPAPVDRNDWRAVAEQMQKRDAIRQKERAEEEEKSRQAQELERACATLRAELRTLESGMRIASVAEDGERQLLDEANRAQRVERLRRDLESHCKQS